MSVRLQGKKFTSRYWAGTWTYGNLNCRLAPEVPGVRFNADQQTLAARCARSGGSAPGAILTLLAYVLLARAKTRRYLTMIPPATVPLGLVVAELAFSAAPAYKASNVLHGLSASKQELFQWAQSTAPDAQFLIPPSLKNGIAA